MMAVVGLDAFLSVLLRHCTRENVEGPYGDGLLDPVFPENIGF
jgi:hypothetical protein